MNGTPRYLTSVLTRIPSHREDAISADELSALVSRDTDMCIDGARAATEVAIDFLVLLNIISCEGKKIKIRGEIPQYFLECLRSYLDNNFLLFDNWDRSGVSKEISPDSILDFAPYFLKLAEERRVSLSQERGILASPSRIQPCSVALIKIEAEGRSFFLHQWDPLARRYQLIGGKRRSSETPKQTIIREIQEELINHPLQYKTDFEVMNYPTEKFTMSYVSSTYGALTYYEFDVFTVSFSITHLQTSVIDRWISINEMIACKTTDGDEIANLGQLISKEYPSLLENIPTSMKSKNLAVPADSFLDSIEIKPKFFGVSVDVKQLASIVREKINQKL